MIHIQSLCKQYQGQVVLNRVCATIPKHQLTCILGASGVGKTTLLRILMGLELADSGTVAGLDDLQKSAVFQEDRLCEHLNIATNILLPHLHTTSALTPAQLAQGLSALDLQGHDHKLVGDLSGGMKRRVALLRALLSPYDILFLDEPFKGLDGPTKEKTMAFFKEKAMGKTVICITHDQAEVAYLAPSQVIELS